MCSLILSSKNTLSVKRNLFYSRYAKKVHKYEGITLKLNKPM